MKAGKIMHFQLNSDKNQKPILGLSQLSLFVVTRAPEQSMISLLFARMSKVLWLIYTRTHCSLKQAQIFKFVLPNDCEIQRFATMYEISGKCDSAFSIVVTGLMCEN